MNSNPKPLVFKVAEHAHEIEQIQRLLYRTFVEEIPQHPPNAERRLVDRFHAENTYLVGLDGERVVATLAMRARRPFSLDSKLADLDRYLPASYAPVEARLLAVDPEYRHTATFTGMFGFGVRHVVAQGHDLAVISGTTRQLELYRNLGFTPFGPLVGTPEAQFQPMYLTLDVFGAGAHERRALRRMLGQTRERVEVLNLLPGPITPPADVVAAFCAPPISHRSREFLASMARVRSRLCQLAGARSAQVLVGSATLAGDVIAAQLSLGGERGLVLSNGEFGERLAGQARRARLPHDWLRCEWGELLPLERVRAALDRLPRGGWLWFAHHETSTGVLNPLRELVRECAARGVRACVDCVSSLGTVPVDLDGVWLASATSGKGLGSYPGLAVVFHAATPQPAPERLPDYLDLGHWAAHDSVPHTHSSNLVAALEAALTHVTPERMERIAQSASWVRGELERQGFRCVAPEAEACPGVVTAEPPAGVPAYELGEQLDLRGHWTSYRSGYLAQRGWLQVALLGDPPRAGLEQFARVLERIVARVGGGRRSAASALERESALASRAVGPT